MPRYATNTTVDALDTEIEIRKTLLQYGAKKYAFATEESRAVVVFEVQRRRIRLEISFPDRKEMELTTTGRKRNEDGVDAAYTQSINQRWRALYLVIKAKLEAVECGISSVEDEFLAYTVLPNGSRVADWVAPQLAAALEKKEMPPMLPG